MRVTKVCATPVMVPVRYGDPQPWLGRSSIDRTIVEIETDQGLVGLGEARGIWPAGIINERFASALIGCGIYERDVARRRCLPRNFDHGFPERLVDLAAYSGVELALWDLAAQAEGVPVHRLLGGPVRQAPEFVAYGYPPDPSTGIVEHDVPRHMAETAVETIAKTTASLFEFKIARYSLDCDIATVHAVRQVLGPSVSIAVDANMGYDPDTARRFLSETQDTCLENFEEPVASLREASQLVREYGVHISTHCTMLDTVACYPAISRIVFDLHEVGGLEASTELIRHCTALGRRVWLRSVWELGIGFAAMSHLIVARKELDRPSQTLIGFAADDLTHNIGHQIDVPGLGVKLDRNALARYTVS